MDRSTTWVVAASLVAIPATAQLTFKGLAYTEGESEKVTVRVWAAGEQLVANPGRLFSPLAETAVRPGTPFTLALPAGVPLPVRLELASPGHVGACLEVLFREQATLPATWLPRGEEHHLLVEGGDAEGQVASWGTVRGRDGDLASLGRLYPCLPRVGARERAVWLPPRAWTEVVAADGEGRWGRWAGLAPAKKPLLVSLPSRPVSVRVLDREGAPREGVLVAAGEAPEGAGRRTDAEGRATVHLPQRGQLAVWALGVGEGARALLFAPPAEEVRLTLRSLPVLEVTVRGPGRVAWEGGWLPRALTGGPAVGEKTLSIPALGHPATSRGPAGELRLWAPGFPATTVGVEEAVVQRAVELKPAARLKVRVVDAKGSALVGVPLWGWRAPARPAALLAGVSREDDLRREWLPDAASDASGWGVVANVPAGPVRVSAQPRRLAEARSPVVHLAAGEERVLTLHTTAGHPLLVAVQDAGGTPIPGVRVEVLRAPSGEGLQLLIRAGAGGPTGELVASAESDGEGVARVEAVPAGAMQVWVTAPGWVTARLDVTVPTEDNRLGPVVLRPALLLRGRVVEESGGAVADAQVTATPAGGFGNAVASARSDGEGWFELTGLDPEGEWELRARASGYAPSRRIKLLKPPPLLVEIPLSRGLTLRGSVVTAEQREAVPGATVSASQEASRQAAGVAQVMTSELIARVETDERGEFVLQGLPGEGVIQVEAAALSFLSSKINVDLARHDEAVPVVISLAPAREIVGTVVGLGERPLAGVEVECRPATRGAPAVTGQGARPTVSGSDGSFRCGMLQEGTYEVSATEREGGAARELVPAGTRDVVLRVQPPGVVEGRVLGEDGGGVAGAKVTVAVGRHSREALSDEGGAFRVDRVPAGEGLVRARASGWAPGGSRITVPAGEVARAEVRLRRGGVVVGRVKGVTSDELRRCQVTTLGAAATPREDGSFRLEGVAHGSWPVRALILPDMKVREAVVAVAAEGEAEVELDFGGGVRLFGTVRRGGRPAVGLTVVAAAAGSETQSSTLTDEHGAWALEGVPEGLVNVVVLNERGEVAVSEQRRLQGPTRLDLAIPEGAVKGRVVTSPTRRPIPGATVSLERDGAPVRHLTTDGEGAFVATELATGSYRLRARAPGFRAGEREVEVGWGVAAEVTITLEEAEEVVVRVYEADGSPARSLLVVAARGGEGEPPVSVTCDREGRGRLTNLKRGIYLALIQGRGVALGRLAVPSADVAVTLAKPGAVMVDLPTPGGQARLRVTQEELGEVVPILAGAEPMRQGWTAVRGSRMLSLPPGRYRLDVEWEGLVRSYPVVLTPGATVRVTVE